MFRQHISDSEMKFCNEELLKEVEIEVIQCCNNAITLDTDAYYSTMRICFNELLRLQDGGERSNGKLRYT